MSRTKKMMEDIKPLERYFRNELTDISADFSNGEVQFNVLLRSSAFLKKFDNYELETNTAGVIFAHKKIDNFIFTAVFIKKEEYDNLLERKEKDEL